MKLIAMVLMVGSGCSAVMIGPPGGASQRDSRSCTSSYVLPAVDAVAAAAITGVATYAVTRGSTSGGAVGGIGMVVDVVALASAVNGFRAVGECRAAK